MGIESERAGFALVTQRAVSAYDEEAVGPGSILLLDAIFDAVEQRRNLDVEFADARGGDILPLCLGSGIGEDDAVFYIALHLPQVAWVSLGDVDDVEGGLAVVPLV